MANVDAVLNVLLVKEFKTVSKKGYVVVALVIIADVVVGAVMTMVNDVSHNLMMVILLQCYGVRAKTHFSTLSIAKQQLNHENR